MEEAQRNTAEVTGKLLRSRAGLRVDLGGYNTVENVRDVKALRQAPGYDQWNVWTCGVEEPFTLWSQAYQSGRLPVPGEVYACAR